MAITMVAHQGKSLKCNPWSYLVCKLLLTSRVLSSTFDTNRQSELLGSANMQACTNIRCALHEPVYTEDETEVQWLWWWLVNSPQDLGCVDKNFFLSMPGTPKVLHTNYKKKKKWKNEHIQNIGGPQRRRKNKIKSARQAHSRCKCLSCNHGVPHP